MPTYSYQIIKADGNEGDIIEIEQSVTDKPLEKHPLTGEKLIRIFSAPGLVTKYSEAEIKRKVSDSQEIEKLGFTRYERDPSSGRYYKTAGSDPLAPESFIKPGKNQVLQEQKQLLHDLNCSCSACKHKHQKE